MKRAKQKTSRIAYMIDGEFHVTIKKQITNT